MKKESEWERIGRGVYRRRAVNGVYYHYRVHGTGKRLTHLEYQGFVYETPIGFSLKKYVWNVYRAYVAYAANRDGLTYEGV